MPFPIIKVDSISGSDTLASGAGPTVALTGTAASTSASGLTVTLDGAPDLTTVAVDGSASIFLNDATAGARNFGKITGRNNTLKTVTVSDAFRLSASGLSWAIGGKRASLFGTTSAKLWNNNSAAGDAMPGWIAEMQSGHVETWSGIRFYRSGNSTDGRIVIRAVSGYATRPILTNNSSNPSFEFHDRTSLEIGGFDLRHTAGTPPTVAFYVYAPTALVNVSLTDILASVSASSGLVYCVHTANGAIVTATNCFFRNTGAGYGVRLLSSIGTFRNCYIKAASVDGIRVEDHQLNLFDSIVHACGGHGIYLDTASSNPQAYIERCTIDGNTGSGIHYTGAGTQARSIINNNITRNGAYGINFQTGYTDGYASNHVILNNNFGTGSFINTSGAHNPATLNHVLDSKAVDPQYVDSANLNFKVGTNVKAFGFPLVVIPNTLTRSYVDIGAAQREEAGGGGSTIFPSLQSTILQRLL